MTVMENKEENTSNEHIKAFKKKKTEEFNENTNKKTKTNDKKPSKGNDKSPKGDKKFVKGDKKFVKGKKPAFNKDGKGVKRKFGEPNKTDEKVDWKRLKTEKKQLKVSRKKKDGGEENGVYEIGVKAKKIWEEIRRQDCKEKRKQELCKDLYALMKGKAAEFIYAHDTVRVVETLLAVGAEEYRTALFEELKKEMTKLSKNKYSRFFVLKLLRYGSREQKDAIIDSFKGHISEFMKHKVASDVVELAYNDFANAKQRSSMLQEFFGPEYRIFKEDVSSLEDVLKKNPEKRDNILKNLHDALQPIVDKGVFTNSMIHSLLKQYLENCNPADRVPIIESLREHLLPIVHTKDGCKVAMLCLWHGTNKDRKAILKSFKGHYLKISSESSGYLVLLAAFDCVDDTVFLKKAVLSELLSDFNFLTASSSGVKVLQYLVAPRLPSFFHHGTIKELAKGDGNATSKKDAEIRRKEIFDAISEPVLNYIEDKLDEWMTESQWVVFIWNAMQNLTGSNERIFKKIAKMCSEPFVPGDSNHFLENNLTTKLITNLIKHDKERGKNNKSLFCTQLLEEAQSEVKGWILTNRGCFLIVQMLETEVESTVKKVTAIVEPLKKKIEKSSFKGAEILLTKLK